MPAGTGSQWVGKCPGWQVGDTLVWCIFKPHPSHRDLRSRDLECLCSPISGGGTPENLGPPDSDDEGSSGRAGQGSGKGPHSPGRAKGSEGWLGPGRAAKGTFLVGKFRPSPRFHRCTEGKGTSGCFTGNCLYLNYTSVRNISHHPQHTRVHTHK